MLDHCLEKTMWWGKGVYKVKTCVWGSFCTFGNVFSYFVMFLSLKPNALWFSETNWCFLFLLFLIDKKKGVGGNSTGGGSSSRNLWVSGLSTSTRATDLKHLFSKYGKVNKFVFVSSFCLVLVLDRSENATYYLFGRSLWLCQQCSSYVNAHLYFVPSL